jgi:hypothetical protein
MGVGRGKWHVIFLPCRAMVGNFPRECDRVSLVISQLTRHLAVSRPRLTETDPFAARPLAQFGVGMTGENGTRWWACTLLNRMVKMPSAVVWKPAGWVLSAKGRNRNLGDFSVKNQPLFLPGKSVSSILNLSYVVVGH